MEISSHRQILLENQTVWNPRNGLRNWKLVVRYVAEEFADQAHILTRLTQSLHAWQEERRSHFQAYSLFTSDSNRPTEDVLLKKKKKQRKTTKTKP